MLLESASAHSRREGGGEGRGARRPTPGTRQGRKSAGVAGAEGARTPQRRRQACHGGPRGPAGWGHIVLKGLQSRPGLFPPNNYDTV